MLTLKYNYLSNNLTKYTAYDKMSQKFHTKTSALICAIFITEHFVFSIFHMKKVTASPEMDNLEGPRNYRKQRQGKERERSAGFLKK